jgi:hypothetical protein
MLRSSGTISPNRPDLGRGEGWNLGPADVPVRDESRGDAQGIAAPAPSEGGYGWG